MTAPAIVCVSANPAIDRRLRLPTLGLGRINRAISAEALPGGKAAHVALSARALGATTAWLGFLGGAAGQEFVERFAQFDIELLRVSISESTRTNLELLEDSGEITEVLEPGARPSPGETTEMLRWFEVCLRGKWRGALVVISGSLPPGVSVRLYRSLITSAKSAGSRVFLDTSGEALRASLSSRPAFVKPNREEVETLLRRRLISRAAIVDGAKELIRRGAKSAAVSLGSEGLVWVERKNGPVWFAQPPRLKSISTVGCGDATVAGFAFAMAEGLQGEKAIRLATACGAANCIAKYPGRISRKHVRSLMLRVKIHEIS